MNATLDLPVAIPPVAIALPPLMPPIPPESVRTEGPRRIGAIMAEVLARHGLDEAGAAAGIPRRSA
jgi:hypothetical protein